MLKPVRRIGTHRRSLSSTGAGELVFVFCVKIDLSNQLEMRLLSEESKGTNLLG